jgi:transcriptional regulator with XRE-family HTH domain
MSETKKAEGNEQEQAADDWAIRWGHLLRMARQVAGLSLSEVAERSGLSKGYLSKLESAHPSAANPSRATLAALARALPSTIPLTQKLDAAGDLPAPRTLLRGSHPAPASYRVSPPEPVDLTSLALDESSAEGLPANLGEWEILLALMILESSGLGPPTLAVLTRACGRETISSAALAHLESMQLIAPLPPGRPGAAIRYTQGPKKLEKVGIQRPADFITRVAITLFLKTEKNNYE